MDARRANFLLRAIGVTSIGAAVAVIAAALIVPRSTSAKARAATVAPATRRSIVTAMPTTRAVAALGDVTLRRSLAEPPKLARPAVDSSTPPGSFGLTLRGTILEPGRPLAVFATPDGETRLIAVGERVEGGEVVAITAADVTLRIDGRPLVLKVPAAAGAAGT